MTLAAAALVLPGYAGSGRRHWQSLWEASDPRLRRVHQRDWFQPGLEEWLGTLVREVRYRIALRP